MLQVGIEFHDDVGPVLLGGVEPGANRRAESAIGVVGDDPVDTRLARSLRGGIDGAVVDDVDLDRQVVAPQRIDRGAQPRGSLSDQRLFVVGRDDYGKRLKSIHLIAVEGISCTGRFLAGCRAICWVGTRVVAELE